MKAFNTLSQWRSDLAEKWLNRRIPPTRSLQLTHKSIFIFPSRFGFGFLMLCGLLFLLGMNYQNNLILMMSFLLLSVFISSMMICFKNLSGIGVQLLIIEPVFAGQEAIVPIRLSSVDPKHKIELNFKDNAVCQTHIEDQDVVANVLFNTRQRGYARTGRLQLCSYFPLGLFKCWSHIAFDNQPLVFAKPIPGDIDLTEDAPDGDSGERSGSEEFSGLKSYVPGESLSRISWKHFARNDQQLVVKEFIETDASPLWLTLDMLQEDPIEVALSKLTHAVCQFSEQDQYFGLLLKDIKISPSQGYDHKIECLKQIALWGIKDE